MTWPSTICCTRARARSLIQGTTTWDGSGPRTRPLPELRARTTWARNALRPELAARSDVPPRVMRVVHPWRADEADLTPISYRYRVDV
ncbi:hypothetical protein FKR81_31425 [Lentzea tibetensis]|uniref:Uncharacterized protein n=1 Tax=Lentzea tibetensis TaxID=2591470 RepID=A0A563ELG0_9PSEU|nr:hypothetical protein [Lentzea tibetensis]TWP47848.1 hypothetical protein FKR81_31425 [Lentzea tibetensis]